MLGFDIKTNIRQTAQLAGLYPLKFSPPLAEE